MLIAFLNTLLPPEAGIVADLSFLPNERVGWSEYDRRAIFDLYCENEKGEKFIVEMQWAKQNSFMRLHNYVHLKSWEECSMINDPIVEEVRRYQKRACCPL